MKKLQTLEELNESLDSVNKEDCLVGDATGYLIPSDDVLSKLTKDEILKMMNKMSDKQYDAQVGNKEKELDELVSATKYLEKYLEVYHNMKIHEVLEGRSKINMDEDASDVYDKFSKKFPNASDLIAYYIFNYKESDNNLLKYIDEYGSDLSSLAMEYENNWEDNMEDIESRLKELLDISEAKTINKDVLNTINMLNFQSDWDDPNEFDFKVDGNQLEAISKEIAADISKDLTADNIEHELNDVYITLTGIVNEAKEVDGEPIELTMVDFANAVKDMFGLDNKSIHTDDMPEILNKYDVVWMGKPIQNDKAGIELMKKIISADGSWTVEESLKEDYSVEKDGSNGYLMGDGESGEEMYITTEEIKKLLGFINDYESTNKDFNGNLNDTLEVELDAEGILIRDTDYDVSLLYNIGKLKDLIMSKVQGINESYTINVGKGEVESQDEAVSLIPAQKEVDGEQVDFQEGESITVSDGENSYKFVWIGGSPTEAPEDEPVTENKKYKKLPLLGEVGKKKRVNEEYNPTDGMTILIKSLMYDYVLLNDDSIFSMGSGEKVPEEIVDAAYDGEQDESDNDIAPEVVGDGNDASIYFDTVNKKYFLDGEYIDDRKLNDMKSKINW